MNLESLRYGVQYVAQYGAQLTEKCCWGARFFVVHAQFSMDNKFSEKKNFCMLTWS